jgi:hypothetical protein
MVYMYINTYIYQKACDNYLTARLLVLVREGSINVYIHIYMYTSSICIFDGTYVCKYIYIYI